MSESEDILEEARLMVSKRELLMKLLELPEEELLAKLCEFHDDMDLWEGLSRRTGGRNSRVHTAYLKACDRFRRRYRTFQGYLDILLQRRDLRVGRAAEKLGVRETTLMSRLTGKVLCSDQDIERMSEVFQFSYLEQARLIFLQTNRRLSLISEEDPRLEEMKGLSDSGIRSAGEFIRQVRELCCGFAEEWADRANMKLDDWKALENGQLPLTEHELEGLSHKLFGSSYTRLRMTDIGKKAK